MKLPSNHLQAAHQALERLRPRVSAATLAKMERHLASWQATADQPLRPATVQPELVMRPGLPPRPLNKHYFTVARTYD
jgi:hypothetical protein